MHCIVTNCTHVLLYAVFLSDCGVLMHLKICSTCNSLHSCTKIDVGFYQAHHNRASFVKGEQKLSIENLWEATIQVLAHKLTISKGVQNPARGANAPLCPPLNEALHDHAICE